MTKHLKDMSLSELQAGYEKGKVTDEEIEQHLLEQVHKAVKKSVRTAVNKWRVEKRHIPYWINTEHKIHDEIKKLAEHEYQKLKD